MEYTVECFFFYRVPRIEMLYVAKQCNHECRNPRCYIAIAVCSSILSNVSRFDVGPVLNVNQM